MNELAFVDTNLFLRYLTNDVPEQADAVERLFRNATLGELRLITSSLVIAEIVWTLESFYGMARTGIKEAVLGILNTPGIDVENSERVIQSIIWYEEKNVDFIDAYHATWMMDQDLNDIYTFDQKHFTRFDHLRVIIPS